jgi:plasmid stabilization system protein ParE
MAFVTLSERARDDIDQIIDFLLQEAGPRVASAYAKRFSDQIELLTHFPGVGTPKPIYGKHVRRLVVFPYVLYYRLETEQVFIQRVLDGRRRITRRMVSDQS